MLCIGLDISRDNSLIHC